jgi:hypothetical protein
VGLGLVEQLLRFWGTLSLFDLVQDQASAFFILHVKALGSKPYTCVSNI